MSLITPGATTETLALYNYLLSVPKDRFLFGAQNTTLYGRDDDGKKRSASWDEQGSGSGSGGGGSGVTTMFREVASPDVKDATDAFPAIYGFDMEEIGTGRNLDGVPAWETYKRNMVDAFDRGGIVTASWHAPNFATGEQSWGLSGNVLFEVLPGGEYHDVLNERLTLIGDYFSDLKTDDGTLIPVIFRPWHEASGDFFWWGVGAYGGENGKPGDSDQEVLDAYKQLFQYTVTYLRDELGVTNVIYSFCVDWLWNWDGQALENHFKPMYPGSNFVDMIAQDNYWQIEAPFDTPEGEGYRFATALEDIIAFADEEEKPSALSETGHLEAQPDWFQDHLLAMFDAFPETLGISYVLVWRNPINRVNEYTLPFDTGSEDAPDFVGFFNDDRTIFGNEIGNVYNRQVTPDDTPVPSTAPSMLSSDGPSLMAATQPPSQIPSEVPSIAASLLPSEGPSEMTATEPPSQSISPSDSPSEISAVVPSDAPSNVGITEKPVTEETGLPSITPTMAPSLSSSPSDSHDPSIGPSDTNSPTLTDDNTIPPSFSMSPSLSPSEPGATASPSSLDSTDDDTNTTPPSMVPSLAPSRLVGDTKSPTVVPGSTDIPSNEPSSGPSVTSIPTSLVDEGLPTISPSTSQSGAVATLAPSESPTGPTDIVFETVEITNDIGDLIRSTTCFEMPPRSMLLVTMVTYTYIYEVVASNSAGPSQLVDADLADQIHDAVSQNFIDCGFEDDAIWKYQSLPFSIDAAAECTTSTPSDAEQCFVVVATDRIWVYAAPQGRRRLGPLSTARLTFVSEIEQFLYQEMNRGGFSTADAIASVILLSEFIPAPTLPPGQVPAPTPDQNIFRPGFSDIAESITFAPTIRPTFAPREQGYKTRSRGKTTTSSSNEAMLARAQKTKLGQLSYVDRLEIWDDE